MHRLLLAVLLAVSVLAPQGAGAATVTGDLTGAPVFTRPNVGTPPTALEPPFGQDRYRVHAFIVDSSGPYDFLLTSAFDNFLILYSGAFDPALPLTNAIRSSDDFQGLNAGWNGQSLVTGTSYFAVVTGFQVLVQGGYSLSITGPSNVSFAAVPAPASLALFGLGLAGLVAVRRGPA